MEESKPIYIKIKGDDLIYEKCKLRLTKLDVGCWGYLIAKCEDILSIHGISMVQAKKVLRMFDQALESKRHLCLVAGFPCVLDKKDFEITEPPIGLSLPVPWELL